ncbi:tetratricopeptide repeat-containing sensor histidine kinase [Altibacter lentus]|uniref:tetratricopeptide repeat-containing sensor histidine kinase n=1 Tax=Altibacter lentus TaxID=1223410 RepID=UPI0005571216|nr:sensor histidine kinase [Altibacter lentus]
MRAQENPSEEIVRSLTSQIQRVKGGEKLRLLDSLSTYIVSKTTFTSDTIVAETVQHALAIDSLRIATWHMANRIYFQNNITGDPEKGNKIFKEFLSTARKIKDANTLAKYYLEGADSFYFLEDHKTSVYYYDLAETYAQKANNLKYVGLAKLYKGGTLSFLGDFSEASQVLQEAGKIFAQEKDTFNSISAKNSLSILYGQNAFFQEAKAERDEAIALAQKIQSYAHLVSFYYNAATDARKQERHEERIANLKLALEASQKTRNPDYYAPGLLAAHVIAYAEVDSLELADDFLSAIEVAPEKFTQGRNREPYLDALKHIALAKNKYGQALTYGKEHLEIKQKGTHYEEIQGAEKFLADTYEAMGNKEQAFVHFKNFSRIKDSINSIQKTKALSYYQTLYETGKRDAQIASQKKDIELLATKNRLQNQWLWFGGFGLFTLFAGVVLIRSRNAARRRGRLQESFSHELIRAQEEERTRVARELHDSVGQKLMLLTKKTKMKEDPEMDLLAGSTLEELRMISRGLYPANLERLGVTKAIESMINEVDANTNIFFTNEIENIDDLLSKEASLHLYRIIQEVLNNMVKHADAKAASVTIERKSDHIEAIIKDNGIGFSYSEKLNGTQHLGMKTILERAKILKSQLRVDSMPNTGTTIFLEIPT